MKKNELLELLHSGREIEFSFSGKSYSITYSENNGSTVINFCEFYKDNHQFGSSEEFLENAKIGEENLIDILKWIENIIVY